MNTNDDVVELERPLRSGVVQECRGDKQTKLGEKFRMNGTRRRVKSGIFLRSLHFVPAYKH